MIGKIKISVIGLGYVGLPLAVELAKEYIVIGFDINEDKLVKYRLGIDVTGEVGDDVLKDSKVHFTSDESDLKKCDFHIVAVPTPINLDKTPNLSPVISATEMVGRCLKKGALVVFESTVYPGTTEEICVPILEEKSGLKLGSDFKVGYSPERINPGDKINTLTTIRKIVSGSDNDSLEIIAKVYETVISAGVFRAESIKVAEAAKVIENSQRDVNIAFMNELAMVFDKMGIDTNAVLAAASTKWNFLNFSPGLVGGHCIGVDPYYFIYKAEQLGYHSQIILSGRKINDDVSKFIADSIVKQLIEEDVLVKKAKVGVFGITFKENCADVRNTKVVDVIEELNEFGCDVIVYDPIADNQVVNKEYSLDLVSLDRMQELDVVVFAVAHDFFLESFPEEKISKMFRNQNKKILIDIKSIFNKDQMIKKEYRYWNL